MSNRRKVTTYVRNSPVTRQLWPWATGISMQDSREMLRRSARHKGHSLADVTYPNICALLALLGQWRISTMNCPEVAPGPVRQQNPWDAAFVLTVGSFLLTVELFYLQLTMLAFFAYSWSFLAYSFSFFTYSWSSFAYSGKVRLIRALRDCKQRSFTVSKKARTVSTRASPKSLSPSDLVEIHSFKINVRPVIL